MLANNFVDSARVMSKGQVTIPKDVRKVLGIGPGSRVGFIVENGSVRIVNSMSLAMSNLQKEMKGAADRLGLTTDEAVAEMAKEIREELSEK